MTIIQAIILGIIQGLTEFLPISSSAHLVIVPYLLGWTFPEDQVFVFDVLVQVGTLLAVIVHFWPDLIRILKAWVQGILRKEPFEGEESRLGWFLILSTIPAGILGLMLKDAVEAVFKNPVGTAGLLLVTALFLIVGEKIGKKDRGLQSLSWKDALWIGIWQAISIFPGISRSGSTITGGLTRNLDRKSSTRYAFLMAVPIMLAVGVLGVMDLLEMPALASFLPVLLGGFVASAVIGYLSIRWLLKFVAKNSLLPFAIYCFILGSLTLLFSLSFMETTDSAVSTQPNKLTIYTTPSLAGLMPIYAGCAQQLPTYQIGYQFTRQNPELSDKSISVQIQSNGDPEVIKILLTEEELIFIGNQQNPIQELTYKEIQRIFSGDITTWENGQPINMYIYPNFSDIQTIFNESILPYEKISGAAFLSTHPRELISQIKFDNNSIGFIPESELPIDRTGLKIITFTEEPVKFPVIAVVPAGLISSLNNWFACIQQNKN